MKKAVAYLVPYMEKEREEREAELKAQGLEITEEVHKLFIWLTSCVLYSFMCSELATLAAFQMKITFYQRIVIWK